MDTAKARHLRIGVLGGRELPTPLTGPIAFALGREIASRGHVLVTGGACGAGGEACRGAHETLVQLGIDPALRIISYVPEGKTPEHGYGRYEHRGFTWKDRRGLLVLEADLFFVVGGSKGTLDEVSAAHRERVPILPIPQSGGGAEALYAQLAAVAEPRQMEALRCCRWEAERTGESVRRLLETAESYVGTVGHRAVLLRGLMTSFHEDRLDIEGLRRK